MRYEHVVRAVWETPWAILPEKLAVITELIRFKAAGGELTDEEIRATVGDRPRPETPWLAIDAESGEPVAALPAGRRPSGGVVAVIPVYGVIQQRMNLMSEMSGGTSTERLSKAVRDAAADPDVRAIVLDIDSPGGGVYGVAELAEDVYRAREQKTVVAVANSLAASAAYWIASAAGDVAVTPGGEVGSIGVFTAHQDLTAAAEMQGVKTTIIKAGRFKAEGNPFEPLNEEARAAIQHRVDEYYGQFVDAVARGRGKTGAEVRGGFGEGRVVGAREAVRLGMADRVATLRQTIERLTGGGVRSTASAETADMKFIESRPVAPAAAEADGVAKAAFVADQKRKRSLKFR